MIITKGRYEDLVEKARNFNRAYEEYKKYFELYKKLSNENEILKKANSELKTDIRKYKAKIIKIESEKYDYYLKYCEMKRQVYNIDNDWHIFNNKAWIRDKKNKKINKYKIPKILKKEKIEDFDFNEDFTSCTIKYEDTTYKIPPSLLEKLYGVKLFNKKNKTFDICKIESTNDVKNIIKNKGYNPNEGYWKSVIDFIIYMRGIIFSTKKFKTEAKLRNPESARIYLNYLINLKLITKIKKGKYKVLFDF